MYQDPFTDIKHDFSEHLSQSEEKNVKEAIFAYILFGTFTNKKFKELPDEQEDKITELLHIIAYKFTDVLDEGFPDLQNETPEGFDLFLMCNDTANDIMEANEVEGDTTVLTDLMLTALAATFRMWYEGTTFHDVAAFFEDKEHKELPNMKDSSITFAWAMKNNIPCSDIRSLFETTSNQEITAEEEKGVYEKMGEMCKMFDVLIPEIVKSGIPQSFIEENLHACRDLFMISQVFSHMMPISVDAEKFIADEERQKNCYKKFVDTMAGEKLRAKLAGEDKQPLFCKIFTFGYKVALILSSRGGDNRHSIYEEATQEMAKAYEGDED